MSRVSGGDNQRIGHMLRLQAMDESIRAEIARLTEQDEYSWSSPNRDSRQAMHAFYRYPAMMVPDVQQRLVKAILTVQPGIQNMIDPFVGAGTTIVSAMCHGLDCLGQDVNPLALLLSRCKTGPFYSDALSSRVEEVAAMARADSSSAIAVDFPGLHKWFRRDIAVELSRLKRAIQQQRPTWARRFLWVVLAETVRLTSNDRTSTYKLHARPPSEIVSRKISPIDVFSSCAKRNLDDLNAFGADLRMAGHLRNGRFRGITEMVLRDTTDGIGCSTGRKTTYDLLITSPPYGDNLSTITYGQHSFLALQWICLKDIDESADGSCLRTTQEIDRRSLGGHCSKDLDEQMAQLSSRSSALAMTFQRLVDKPRDRTARIATFYADFDKALNHIVNALSENAYMVWIVGNRCVGGVEIPNDQILMELLRERSVPVTHVKRRICSKRMPHKNSIARMMSTEQIMIFRKTLNGSGV